MFNGYFSCIVQREYNAKNRVASCTSLDCTTYQEKVEKMLFKLSPKGTGLIVG